ncbi:MAG: glycine cleavage system aminomethyltransferase GcvT [Chloroflexota bacterium]
MAEQELKRTQLYEWHVANGGRMVPFAGWEMPVQYKTGALAEHRATRQSAGIFDIDHMGQIRVTGPDATAYLNRLLTWDISEMGDYDAHYALMCREDGTILDDTFIYRLPDAWFVVVNASNLAKNVAWMESQMDVFDVTVTDVSLETYMLALQGPHAIALLQQCTETDLSSVPRFTAFETTLTCQDTQTQALVGRTGYTGEDGVELFFPAKDALGVWEGILATGAAAGIEVTPVGLAARDSLRFEPGFPLYGHEIDDDITPIEARLNWACRFDSDFIGKERLLAQKANGVDKKLIAFKLTDKGVPRQDYAILNEDGDEIGKVVTGMYAPSVDLYCGHGFVPPAYAKRGTNLQIAIRKKNKSAVVVRRPFYKPAYKV